MRIIQITNNYGGEVLRLVQSCVPEGFTVRVLAENSEDALKTAIPEADYLIASGRVRVGVGVLDAAVRLKMIQRTGVGLDSLDLDAISRRQIPLYVNKGVNSDSVAEHALLLILACLRRLTVVHGNTSAGIWKKQAQGIQTHELRGKTVGIIGMGSIGQALAVLLRGFGVTIIYHDAERLSTERESELNIAFRSFNDLLRESDIISLHCPLTAETENMICENTLRMMKDGVIIVNTARGGLIREQDLLRALNDSKVSFAGLDVFASEPVSGDDPLLASGQVIATPHIGGITRESFTDMIAGAMRNIRLFEEGEFERLEFCQLKI